MHRLHSWHMHETQYLSLEKKESKNVRKMVLYAHVLVLCCIIECPGRWKYHSAVYGNLKVNILKGGALHYVTHLNMTTGRMFCVCGCWRIWFVWWGHFGISVRLLFKKMFYFVRSLGVEVIGAHRFISSVTLILFKMLRQFKQLPQRQSSKYFEIWHTKLF